MQVRKARPQDAQDIQTLYRLLVVGDDNIRVDPSRIQDLQDDATNHLFVVEDQAVVCGTAFLTVCLDSMYGFAPYAVVENIIVLPAARRKGAGRALMAAVEAAARAARCTKLMLLSSRSRADAHRFFAFIGYDGDKKRGFIKYLNRTPALTASG
jgi:N-acetylglutamate synthase-like GNAT family acetyltransferase